MTYDPITDAWSSYWLARFYQRLSLVADHTTFWAGEHWERPILELYAWESGPLWRAV